jgi:hypothetical protein
LSTMPVRNNSTASQLVIPPELPASRKSPSAAWPTNRFS